MGGVLLTDGQQRKTLVAVRSLGRRGVTVWAAEETRWAPALFSKYCTHALVSPSAEQDPAAYLAWLLATWDRFRYDVLCPMDDASLAVVLEHRDQLEPRCRMVLPPLLSYRLAADKGLAVEQARAAGLDCPKTVQPQSMGELHEIAGKLRYPVLIRPRHSSGSRGIVMVRESAYLGREYHKVHQEYPWPILQEYIPQGDKYDVCLLYNARTELRAAFAQREVRFFPSERGPSTVQVSVKHPHLVQEADRLMQRLRWQGIAEVEFMVDPRSGQPVFMEINPRFWGSLACAVFAGIDFPYLLYRMAIDGDIPPAMEYRADVWCRWLLPGDLLHFVTNPQRWRMKPALVGRSLSDDIIAIDDPMPVLGFVTACLRYALDSRMWKKVFER